MKAKKILCIVLCMLTLFSAFSFCSSAVELDAEALNEKFVFGKGPKTDGYVLDYRYYSPVKKNDTKKYPLVIWLHGMANGGSDGAQLENSNISYWASKEMQKRFKGTKGAFILAPRSLEEEGIYWSDDLIYPLRKTIDKFISKNKKNIDTKRIYIGGYSMGGKMTLKMAVSYPEMFAAIFPICPAWVPGQEASARLKNTPMWLTSGATDTMAHYYAWVTPTWKNIVAESNIKDDLRFSTLDIVCYANGVTTLSQHFAWYAVNSDMFSQEDGDYPFMRTVDGNGERVDLTYPNGMISWLSSHKSKFNGKSTKDRGDDAIKDEGAVGLLGFIPESFKNRVEYIIDLIKYYRDGGNS